MVNNIAEIRVEIKFMFGKTAKPFAILPWRFFFNLHRLCAIASVIDESEALFRRIRKQQKKNQSKFEL